MCNIYIYNIVCIKMKRPKEQTPKIVSFLEFSMSQLDIYYIYIIYILYIYNIYIYSFLEAESILRCLCSHISCVSYVLHGFRKVILPVIVCIIPIFAQLFHWLQSPFQRVPATYVRQSSSILRVSEGTEHR